MNPEAPTESINQPTRCSPNCCDKLGNNTIPCLYKHDRRTGDSEFLHKAQEENEGLEEAVSSPFSPDRSPPPPDIEDSVPYLGHLNDQMLSRAPYKRFRVNQRKVSLEEEKEEKEEETSRVVTREVSKEEAYEKSNNTRVEEEEDSSAKRLPYHLLSAQTKSGQMELLESCELCDACPFCDDVCTNPDCVDCGRKRGELQLPEPPFFSVLRSMMMEEDNREEERSEKREKEEYAKTKFTFCELKRHRVMESCWIMRSHAPPLPAYLLEKVERRRRRREEEEEEEQQEEQQEGSVSSTVGIYNVTSILDTHPGGLTSLLRYSGGRKDCYEDALFHRESTQQRWEKYRIGNLGLFIELPVYACDFLSSLLFVCVDSRVSGTESGNPASNSKHPCCEPTSLAGTLVYDYLECMLFGIEV